MGQRQEAGTVFNIEEIWRKLLHLLAIELWGDADNLNAASLNFNAEQHKVSN